MGKVQVILYMAVTCLVLFLISHSPTKSPSSSSHHHNHRRLILRKNLTFPHHNNKRHENKHHENVAFDPVVGDIERRIEDLQWKEMVHDDVAAAVERKERKELADAEDYLNDVDRFNISKRLVVLFPNVDVDPVDGFVTEEELTVWQVKNSEREKMHRTEREMEMHDKNRDGLVSFQEYDPPTSAHTNSDSSSSSSSFGNNMSWWKEEHFYASDANGDGFLNITEFNNFLHPSDSKNPKLLEWLCREEIRERDADKDGKVSFYEFIHGLYDSLRNDDDRDSGDDDLARKLFQELDKDGDRYLSVAELMPVVEKLHPSERHYAKQQAHYIISQADTDKDGRLTLGEMIDNPYVFYSAIFNEEDEDDDNHYDYHDEFR